METFNTPYGLITLYRNETFIINDFREGSYWEIGTLNLLKKYIDPSRNILEIGGHCGTSSIVYSSYLNVENKLYVYDPKKTCIIILIISQNNL